MNIQIHKWYHLKATNGDNLAEIVPGMLVRFSTGNATGLVVFVLDDHAIGVVWNRVPTPNEKAVVELSNSIQEDINRDILNTICATSGATLTPQN